MTGAYILEPDSQGHRWGYVVAVIDECRRRNLRICIGARQDTLDSVEFGSFVGAGLEGIEVDLLPNGNSLAVFRHAAREARRRGLELVIPHGDPFLPYALTMVAFPRRVGALLMRPPSRSAPVTRVLKWVAMIAAVAAPRVSVGLLSSPIDNGMSVWGKTPALFGRRVPDPAGLASAAIVRPPELGALDGPFVAVVGVLDSRKRIGDVIGAWAHLGDMSPGSLVVAGAMAEDVRVEVGKAEQLLHRSTIIDRFLTSAEFSYVVEKAEAVLVLYDEQMSSGVVLEAASRGTAVISYRDTSLGRACELHQLGVAVDRSPVCVADAIRQALKGESPGRRRSLPDSEEFAGAVLSLVSL